MNNLVELRSQRFFLIALPVPIVGLDAIPVRAIGIVPEG
jgi:kynurenine formamidase